MNPLQRIARMLSGLLLCVFFLPVLADPPSLVGRVAVVEGDVRLIPEAGAEPIASPYNFPLVPDSRLYSGANGRAALQVGNVSLWLAEDSELGFLEVDEDVLDLDLASGLLVARVGAAPDGEAGVRVATLPAGVSLLEAGRYRVESDSVETRVIVSDGLARVEAGGDVAYVSAGQTLVATTGGVLSHGDSDPAEESDAFAHWVSTHGLAATGETVRYVSPAMTGWQDLDTHGYWRETIEYGPLWTPARVPHGWAPYRHGKWVWLSPWGWTWVDHAPWGFAPFHYGRWVEHRGRWWWSPGHRIHRPAFAPGLVIFDWDDGRHFRHHRHKPPKKWRPLGPRDEFEPHFDTSPRFRERFNAPHLDRDRIRHADTPLHRLKRHGEEARHDGREDGRISRPERRDDGRRPPRIERERQVADRFRDSAPPPGFAADTRAPVPRAVPSWRGVGPARPEGVRPPDARGVTPNQARGVRPPRIEPGVVDTPDLGRTGRPAIDPRRERRGVAEPRSSRPVIGIPRSAAESPAPNRPAMRGIQRSRGPETRRQEAPRSVPRPAVERRSFPAPQADEGVGGLRGPIGRPRGIGPGAN